MKKTNLTKCSTHVLALTLMLCLMTACKKNKQNEKVQLVNVVEVYPTAGTDKVSYPAKTEAINKSDLSFKVAGNIAQVLVKEGDYVTAGQVVARLDDRDYRTQLRATEAEYHQIKAECDRVMAMHKERSVSDNNYDKARYGLLQITEKLAHHRNQVSDCVICAPFSGYVNEVYKHSSEVTGPGMPVLSVYSSKGVDVVINIPERTYVQRKELTNYTATFNSMPGKTFPLTVRSVAAMANDNHLYEMRLSLRENVPNITPGMTAMVEVDQKLATNFGFKVPVGAVLAEDQKSYVFLYDKKNSTVRKTAITTERLENDGIMLISTNLKGGSQIVTSGVHHLTDGQKVSLQKETSSLNVGKLK